MRTLRRSPRAVWLTKLIGTSTAKSTTSSPKAPTATRIQRTIPVEHHADWNADDDVKWILSPPWMASYGDDASRDAEPASERLGEVEYSATGYFGNEGGDAAFYVSAVLLLEIPPARERAGPRAPQSGITRKARERTRGRPRR